MILHAFATQWQTGKEATFEVIDKMILSDLGALAGKPLVLLTSSISSPTTKTYNY
ncbi:MAG: hypothetical protein WKF59_16365 [Chitinophagaceae bacterium]